MAKAMTSAIAVAVVFVLGTVAASDEGFVGVGCEESSTCPCPKNLDPVCDGQGKEYGNQCIFDCVKERCPGKVAARTRYLVPYGLIGLFQITRTL